MRSIKEVISKNKYIKLIKDSGNTELYFVMIIIVNNEWVDELQAFLNKNSGETLMEDGVLGLQTLFVLDKVMLKDPTIMQKFLVHVSTIPTVTVIDSKDKLENTVMNFLADAESTLFHYNKKEKSYTSPYGVYAYANRKSDIVKYCDSLFLKYNLDKNNRRSARKLNPLLKQSEKIKIKQMAWSYYKASYVDEDVLVLLDKLSGLTYFSLSINGGKPRGNKAIQGAIGATKDGHIGKNSIGKLKKFLYDNDYPVLNFRMLSYMQDFFNYLINTNPDKYKINENGWHNRLLKTSCGKFK